MFELNRSLGRRMSRFALYLLAITAIAVSPSSPAATSGHIQYKGTPAAPSNLISGTASWDQNMVRAFFKATMDIDIANVPAAIPNQDMLDKLSPEFARRVKVLMAVYQASVPTIAVGIVSPDGALRTLQQQINLWEQCRRPPFRQRGSSQPLPPPDQWVLDDHPTHTGIYARPPRAGSLVVGRYVVSPDDLTLHYFIQSQKYCPLSSPATWETVSWHNFGVAADFGQFLPQCGKNHNVLCYNNGNTFFGTKAWIQTRDAMRNLGMLTGADFDDGGHVDWHPKLVDPKKVSSPGTAYNVDAGYHWQIPSKIYTLSQSNMSPIQELFVLELAACDNEKWICVKEMRFTQFKDKNNWQGDRITFSPAIKAFPAYTPVQHVEVYSNYNKAIHGMTKVVHRSYSISGSGGNRSDEEWNEWGGPGGDYAPDFEVTDELARADLEIGHARRWGKTPRRYAYVAQFTNLRDHSIYAVALRGFDLLGQSGRSTHKQWRRHNDDASVTTSAVDGAPDAHVSFGGGWFGWNRDDGTVGQQNFDLALPPGAVYRLWVSLVDESGHITVTVSGSQPKGATDEAHYPPPPAATSPTPSPTDTGSGFFQP